MEHQLHQDDRTVLTFVKARVTAMRDSINEMSDEYELMSDTSIAIAQVGSRIGPVLVALDSVLNPDVT